MQKPCYVPPAVGSSTGFNDIPTNHAFATWIKQLKAEGATNGCGNGNYCPDSALTREQAAYFLVSTFDWTFASAPDAVKTSEVSETSEVWQLPAPKVHALIIFFKPLASNFSNATFTYDGDGRRVKSVINEGSLTTTTYFVGNHYEVANGVVTKYYFAGASRIAMRKNGTLSYIISDHLGSTSLVTDSNGAVINQTKYKAWGEVRYSSGTNPSEYTYTGQYSYAADFGLMFYNARWYDPYLNHFTQPDSIVPDPYNPQDWDRYSYARNNPLKYTDPTGHCAMDADADDCFRPGFNNPPSLADYGVTVDPKMTNNEKRAILEAVVRVGDAFAAERGLGELGVEAFAAVYDPITINTGRAGGGCETVINTITCGSFAKEDWHRLQTSVINIVHELGHVFDPIETGVWGSGSSGLPQIFVDNNTTILRDNYTIQWRPNTEFSTGEVFGNFFVAWVYGEWGPDADRPYAGVDSTARNWMTTNMSEWLTP